MMRKKLLLMGFSGSIGKQTLDLLKEDEEYELVGIAANTSYYEVDQILDSFPSITSVAFSGLSSIIFKRALSPKYIFLTREFS